MSYEFKKINEVPIMDKVDDNSMFLIEDDGELKRIDSSLVGGNLKKIPFTFQHIFFGNNVDNYYDNFAFLDQERMKEVFEKNGMIIYIVQHYFYSDDDNNYGYYGESEKGKYTFEMRTFPFIKDFSTLTASYRNGDVHKMYNETGDMLIRIGLGISDNYSIFIETSPDKSIVGVYTNV